MGRQLMPRVMVLDLLSVAPFYDERLVAELRKIDPDVQLIAVSPHRSPQFFEERGLPTNHLIVDRVAFLPEALLERARPRRLAKAIEYHVNMVILIVRLLLASPDVVHTQWMPMLGFSPVDRWFVELLRLRRIPLVHTVHNVLPHDDDTERVRNAYAGLYENATLLLCHTEETAGRLVREFNVSRHRVEVIPHGPLFGASDDVATDEARRRANVDAGSHVVLALGGIRPYKGLEFLLRSWQMVESPGACLVIAGVGDPRYVKEIVDLADNLGLAETVDIRPGYVPDIAHDALHRIAEVAVLPYQHIDQSGALMTAMAYGCAIVATDIGGFPEVIENARNGILVPYGDTEVLAGALTDLLSNPEQRQEFGRTAISDTTTRFSWESIARRTMQCYRRAIHLNTETRKL